MERLTMIDGIGNESWYGVWAFVADGIRDTTDTYGRVFVAFWDEPGRCDNEA